VVLEQATKVELDLRKAWDRYRLILPCPIFPQASRFERHGAFRHSSRNRPGRIFRHDSRSMNGPNRLALAPEEMKRLR
jgi:hypothetical protein